MPVVAITVVLVGAVGFLFWNNIMNKSADKAEPYTATVKSSDEPKPKSEIIVLKDGDMNKYVNHEKGFEFLFPKQIRTANECKEYTEAFDRFGNKVASEPRMGASDGPMDVVVLEAGDDYTIAAKETVVLSDPEGTSEKGYIYKSCDKVATTVDLMNEDKRYASLGAAKSMYTESRTFKVLDTADRNDALSTIRQAFGDSTGTLAWKDDPGKNRQSGEFVRSPNAEWSGGFAYDLWYYPKERMTVFMVLGHSVSFAYPDGSEKAYINRIIDSFKPI